MWLLIYLNYLTNVLAKLDSLRAGRYNIMFSENIHKLFNRKLLLEQTIFMRFLNDNNVTNFTN